MHHDRCTDSPWMSGSTPRPASPDGQPEPRPRVEDSEFVPRHSAVPVAERLVAPGEPEALSDDRASGAPRTPSRRPEGRGCRAREARSPFRPPRRCHSLTGARRHPVQGLRRGMRRHRKGVVRSIAGSGTPASYAPAATALRARALAAAPLSSAFVLIYRGCNSASFLPRSMVRSSSRRTLGRTHRSTVFRFNS